VVKANLVPDRRVRVKLVALLYLQGVLVDARLLGGHKTAVVHEGL
jgi:hypothetical protein